MKYLVEDWGMPKFRSVVEQYYGKTFQPFRCCDVNHYSKLSIYMMTNKHHDDE